MKMAKRIIGLLLALTMLMSLEVSAFAGDTVNAQAGEMLMENGETDVSITSDTVRYYELRNERYLRTERNIIHYITNIWAPTSAYNLSKTESKTSSLSVSATSGSFPLSNVKSAAVGYNTSLTRSFTVGVTIPADPDRNSKLVIEEKKNVYSADLYYVLDYGHTTSSVYRGSGYMHVPTDLYLVVVYEE